MIQKYQKEGKKMFDLKMCLLDLIGLQVSPKPKKSLKEISNRYSSNFMQKYNELNVIHFNENMSMTSKTDTIQFARYPRPFRKSPISNSFSNSHKSFRDWGIETVNFEFSSDDLESNTLTPAESTNSTDEKSSDSFDEADGELSDVNVADSPIDSFCTLCTSSFSYNNCDGCQGQDCGSKCSADDACSVCLDRSVGM